MTLAMSTGLTAFGLLATRPSPAHAVRTSSFSIDSASDFRAGESAGASVLSTGELIVGQQADRIELPDIALVYAMTRGPDGALFLGTGQGGKIFRVRGDAVEEIGDTEQLLVSSLALGEDGTLYAGTIPEGRVFALPAAGGELRELAQLEGAEHVWALVPHAGGVLAATGPEGKVFAIDRRGNASVYYESTAQHVMSLARDGDSVYAGTSDDAVVLRLIAPGRAEVVHDFPGNEITAIAARDGGLAVAANEFPSPPRVGATKNGLPQRPDAGHGRLFRVGSDGRVEEVHDDAGTHYSDVALDSESRIYAAEGRRGRVLRVDADRASAVLVEVEERQVLTLDVGGETPAFATGDAGALYRVSRRPAEAPSWVSKVLDARFRARFGQLTWRGSGRLKVSTRSGNRETPDETWSEWSAPIREPGPVRSPGARYVQIRVEFDDADARVRALDLYYLPQNQRPVVTAVRAEEQSGDSASERYKLVWTVDNPDSDDLRYRVRFRAEDQTRWRDMFTEDVVHTSTHYRWDTTGIPDGLYVIDVEASDERANPADLTLRSRAVSEPIRIDNHAPRVENLQRRGQRVSGRVVDSLGPIARIEVAVDGGPFRDIFPVDHLLDTAEERFEIDLPELESGSHIVAIRARDAGDNVVVAEIER